MVPNPTDRIYARIVRRAGRGDAWESVPKMVSACFMSESRAHSALQLLEAAGLIESYERSGYSTIRRLTPKQKWSSELQSLCWDAIADLVQGNRLEYVA